MRDRRPVIKMAGRAITALLAVCLSVIASTEARAWTPQQAERVRAFLNHYLDSAAASGKWRPPGLSIAIGINGELAMAEGFGDDGRGKRPDANTVYRIGSITKQFTAATVLRLIELGAVSPLTGDPLTLDTLAADIIAGVENWTQPEQAPITVRSLLTMTSNLPNFTRRPPPKLDPWGMVALPDLLGAVKQLRPQGWRSSFEYSNTNYFILAAIIDSVTLPSSEQPLPYRDAVRSLMIEPQALKSTAFYGASTANDAIAMPHFRRRPAFGAADWLRGSGDMVSSARDIWAWNASLMSGRALDQQSLREMFSESARVTPTLYYGMGWYVSDSDGCVLYSHSGSVPGYTAMNAICRQVESSSYVSVTLLSNADGVEDLDEVADALIRMALEN